MPTSEPVLITLGVSHFCEKARWALQRYGLPFVEEGHAPGPHRAAAKAAGGCGSVPCLRLPQAAGSESVTSRDNSSSFQPAAQCVDGSTPILCWVDMQCAAAAAAAGQPPPPPLFPAGAQGEEVAQLCERFDSELGPATRVWAYSHLLHTPAIAAAMVAPPVPAVERLAMCWGGWWVMRRLMAKGMNISQQNGAAALEQIKKCFDEVAALLADGRPYLAGTSFTAADLTFAALAAPAVGQPYAAAPGLDESTPPAMREQVEQLRQHPAGRFALKLWAEERGTVLR